MNMQRFPRQRWLTVLVVILLLTNIITLSFIWFADKPRKQQGTASKEKRMGQFMVNELKFDKDQEARYWQMRDTLVSQQRVVMDSMRTAKRNFFNLLKQPPATVSDSLLTAKGQEVNVLQRKLDLLTFHHFQRVKTLCTPEQLQKFDTVIAEIVNRMTTWKRPQDRGDSTKTNKP